MLLQIHPADDGSPATWAMIELQGEIERKDGGLEGEAFDVGMLSTSSSVRFIPVDSFSLPWNLLEWYRSHRVVKLILSYL